MRTVFLRHLMLPIVDVGISVLTWYMVDSWLYTGTGSAWQLILLAVCMILALLVFGVNRCLWRHAVPVDYFRLMFAVMTGFVIFSLAAQIVTVEPVSFSIVFVASGFTALLTLVGRLAGRQIWLMRRNATRTQRQTIRLAVVGAGMACVMLLSELARRADSRYLPICLIDDDSDKFHRRIQGIQVEGPISRVATICQKFEIDEIVVAIPSVGTDRQRAIYRQCAEVGLPVKILPDTVAMIDDPKSLIPALRTVNISDLLGRGSVDIDDSVAGVLLHSKTVLVTGGGGSIGSELCRQIIRLSPSRIIILDMAENSICLLVEEIRAQCNTELPKIHIEIANIQDATLIRSLFERYKPQFVFHAAAHKHVPLMEDCPIEAVKNNILGTWNVMQAAINTGVKKFVLLSTDKAVSPTSIMGATKRFCEVMVMSMIAKSDTCFSAVRFGNVLASQGSVVPLFERQIASGGPVTVTHRDMTRYFMTIPEAASLVLHSAAMAAQSDIFVLDMGEPMCILDMAETMIRLSGLRPNIDVDIIETGLRPGERLFETLSSPNEPLRPTEHPKINAVTSNGMTYEQVEQTIAMFARVANDGNDDNIRAMLSSVVGYSIELT